MATQVDGAWCNVDVHQVVDNSALDVVEDAVDQVTAAHIHDLYVGQIPGARESSQLAVVLRRWFISKLFLCILTCPEPRPEAGRRTRNT